MNPLTTEFLAPEGYSLERQLAIARRRLADARVAAHRAIRQFHANEARDSHVDAIRLARARVEAAAAQCRTLGAAIANLETQRSGRDRPPVRAVG